MPSIDGMETNCEWTTGQQAQDYGTTLLEDDAVVLRESEPEDFEVLAPWWNDPRWAVLQQRVIKPRPSQHLADMFASWCVNRPESGEAGFSIFEKATGALVGHVTLYGGTLPHRAADLSIMIGPEYVDKGLGTRAVKLMCGYGFKELGLHRVALKVAAFNSRAKRAYEKSGFILEGRERGAYFHDGKFHDQLVYGLLADEYFSTGA